MVKEKLINLLSAGKLNEALDILLQITKDGDKEIYNDLLLLASQLNANDRMFNLEILDYSNLKIEKNRIFNSILNYVETISSHKYFIDLTLADVEKKSTPIPEKKLKILFIATNPIGTPKFQLEKEYLDIRKIFNNKREQFEVIESFNATLDQVFNAVRIEKPDILHITGTSTDKYLILHKPDDTIRCVPYNVLSSAFTMFQPYVKCVFINTWCSTIFLKQISHHLECAIGSKNLVNDNLSVLFSTGFYSAVAQGQGFDKAFLFAIQLIRNDDKYSSKELPFVIFNSGQAGDASDDTPEDFDIQEPQEILKMMPKLTE